MYVHTVTKTSPISHRSTVSHNFFALSLSSRVLFTAGFDIFILLTNVRIFPPTGNGNLKAKYQSKPKSGTSSSSAHTWVVLTYFRKLPLPRIYSLITINDNV